MDEDRYCQEMLKPERGGVPYATSKAKFVAMAANKIQTRDRKDGRDRVRVVLDDRVIFFNKFTRFKHLSQ
eukprot:9473146-Lingulodinium_polyedra.AAC.1